MNLYIADILCIFINKSIIVTIFYSISDNSSCLHMTVQDNTVIMTTVPGGDVDCFITDRVMNEMLLTDLYFPVIA